MTEMLKHGRLEGKHVLVTGGLSGIGRAIVVAMAAEGASVTIMDKISVAREDGLGAKELCERIGPKVRWLQGDVASERDVEAVFAEIVPIDVLVNNAGVTTFKPLQSCTVEDFDRLMAVNVKGVFLMTRSAINTWISRPNEPVQSSM